MPAPNTLDQKLCRAAAEEWTPAHTKILLMHSEGKSSQKIANEMALKVSSVNAVLKNPNLQKRLEEVRNTVVQTVVSQRLEMMNITTLKEARKILEDSSKMAVGVVVSIARGDIEGNRVQLDACKDILDRVGLKALVITETRERVYSPEEVSSAKKILVEAQDIVARLSNETSPFILGDTKANAES